MDESIPIEVLKNKEIVGSGLFFDVKRREMEGQVLSGKFTYEYHGQVINGRPHGIGRLFYTDFKTLIEGQFVDGKPNGFVRIIEGYDALHYRGLVKDFKRHGQGKHFEAIFSQNESLYENDKDISDQKALANLHKENKKIKYLGSDHKIVKLVRLGC